MKRLFDLCLVVALLPLWLPILVMLMAAQWIILGLPIFFFQERAGRQGAPFRVIKLRTMADKSDEDGDLLSDADRLTRYGRWLRATSLDELPEVINVLKGEMSFVGPRPLLMRYLPFYSERQARRHEVRPGITGWAQVNGRNEISWERKFELDIWYIDNHSLWLDLKILFLTIICVFQKEGINHSSRVTMPEFAGGADTPPAQLSHRNHTRRQE